MKKFDKLKELLNDKIKNGEIIVLDKVVSESNKFKGDNVTLPEYPEIGKGVSLLFLLSDFSKTQDWYL